jgi:hypothetical protein
LRACLPVAGPKGPALLVLCTAHLDATVFAARRDAARRGVRHVTLLDRMRSAPFRLAATGVAFLTLALATYGALRVTFGDRPARVNIRWAPSVQPDLQQRLEQTYHLASGLRSEGRTFSYDLTDLSRSNIRALVADPAVEDTHYIHRTAFRVGRFTPRSPYPGRGAKWGPLMEATILLLMLAGATAMAFALIELVGPDRIRRRVPTHVFLNPAGAAAAVHRAIAGKIPDASAEQVALFRIVFGVALLALFSTERVGRESALDVTNTLSALHWILISPFVAAPQAVSWVLPWLLFWGVLFVAGAAAPLAFGMVTAGAIAWAALLTTRVSYHTVCAPLLALLCLCGSRWSDAWSIDAWQRRRSGRPPVAGTPREYGYTIWIPGLVLGMVFAAAAVAKLRESGIAWILNGTVKYHFLSDARQAPFDWGLRVGRHPELAVALSLAAVVTEALIIVGVCSRAYRYRLLAGASAMALLLGFAVFQGLFWPGWWLLLLSFLPWHRWARPARAVPVADRASTHGALFRLQPLIVVAVVGQQIVVSGLRLEAGPVFSTYGMYSTTYASPAEYEAQLGTSYWLVASDGRECSVRQPEAEDVIRARTGSSPRSSAGNVAQRCFGPVDPGRVAVEQRRTSVDWAQWRFRGVVRTPMTAPVSVDDAR